MILLKIKFFVVQIPLFHIIFIMVINKKRQVYEVEENDQVPGNSQLS